METDETGRCVRAGDKDGDSAAALLAEFRTWLDRERGLSLVSVRCYSKQAKYFLAAVGGPGAVSGLDAGRVTTFMMEHSRDRNSGSAKAMVTSLRAFLRFARATGRTAAPLATAVPAVASWRPAGLSHGVSAAEVDRLLACCDRGTAAGLRDYAVLSLLARLGLRGAEAAGLLLGDIDWRAGEIAVTGKGSRVERLPLPAGAGEALAAWLTGGRPRCKSRAVFVTVRRPYRPLTPEAVRAVMGRACDRAGLERRGAHRLRHVVGDRDAAGGRRCPRSARCCGTGACCPRRCMPNLGYCIGRARNSRSPGQRMRRIGSRARWRMPADQGRLADAPAGCVIRPFSGGRPPRGGTLSRDPDRAERAGQRAARSLASVRVPCSHHDACWVFGAFQYPTLPLHADTEMRRHALEKANSATSQSPLPAP
jgi:integrase/recombinase XerD